MKRTLTYNMVWMLLAIMAFASCTNDDQLEAPELPASTPRLSIGVSTVKQEADTRATIYTTSVGVTALNENRINKLDIYLYKMEGGNVPTAQSVKHITISNIDENSVYTIPMQPLSITELKDLLGENNVVVGAQCYAYVIANAPASISGSMSGNRTIYDLQKIELPATTHTFYNNAKQDNLVMDGSNAVTLRLLNDTYTLTGDINLNRAASKMDLVITEIKSPVVDDRTGHHWTPLTDQIYVGLYNGVKRGQINQDNLRNEDKITLTDDDYFHFLASSSDYATSMRKMNQVQVGTDEDNNPIYHYEMEVPFYTYQQNWTNNQRKKPYYSLMVRWQRVEEDEHGEHPIVNTFYQIPVTTEFNYMNRNVYYRMEAVVSAIGSSLEEIPDILLEDNTFIVLDWSDRSNLINISMRELKYLSVEFNEWTLNNENSGSVNYATSHPATATVTQVKYINYAGVNPETITLNSSHTSQRLTYSGSTYYNSLSDFTASTDNGVVTLSHELKEYMFSEFEITVRVTNTAGLSEEIVFIQRPAITITGERSSGNVFVNGRNYANTYRYGNYRVVYDDRGTGNTNYFLGTIANPTTMTGTGTNTNPNHYIITTSSLAGSSYTNYSIGDPRNPQVNNLSNLSRLSHYHPTLSTTETTYMVSPAFLIASSYGALNYYTNWEQGQKRCASYQEDGYPAGRWRMPTFAEVEYIMTLSAQGVIPSLFRLTANDQIGYWCANGKIVGNANALPELGTNTDATAVRCVYDIWYWGDEHATGTAAQSAIKGDNKTNEELMPNWNNPW